MKMNQLVELTLDLRKLKFNEELFKHLVRIVKKTKIPPVIITCIGSSSFYNEYTVKKFLTCLESRPDFTIVDVNETQDLDDAKGIKLAKEIYRKNGNSAEDLAIFVFTLNREKIKDENHFNQLSAFAAIISSVILQTDYSILWKDINGRVSKWIINQEKSLKKKSRVACYPENFSEFGENIFTNELVGIENVSPELFGTFLRYAANLVETGLYPILNGGDGGNTSTNETLEKLENNSDVDMLDIDQELGDHRDQLIPTKENPTFSQNSGYAVNLQQSTNGGAKQNILNRNSNGTATGPEEMKFDNQSKSKSINHQSQCQPQALAKSTISLLETQTEQKTEHFKVQSNHQINHNNETQTDETRNCILMPLIGERQPLIILTKNPDFHKQLQELVYEKIYNEIEKKVEEIHYSSNDHLLSHFTHISNEILSQYEVYQPEKDQNHTLFLGQNLLPTLQIFLEKFQNSGLFQSWGKVFTALEMLYTILSEDFIEKMKKMQSLHFSGWDLYKWSEIMMSSVCNKNEISSNLEFFKKYAHTTMGFGKVLKNFQDIIKVLSIYNDEAKNYFSNYMQNIAANAKFEEQFSKLLVNSCSKAELGENFVNLGDYFPDIMNESVKVRNQTYEKIYLENERKMLENCTKLAKCMKTKFESKMNEFFPIKTLSTLKQIKCVAKEFRTFCTEFFTAKFNQEHDGVSTIWKDFELDMVDVVRNTILKIDAFGDDLEKDLFTIETSTYKLAESKASSLEFCQNESASYFQTEISKKSNLLFDDRIEKIMVKIAANFSKYQEKHEASAQAQAQASNSQLQDPLLNVNESQNISVIQDINICINLGYDMIQVMVLKDKSENMNLDKPCRKSFKNQIGLDSQGLLCFGKNADKLNKIHGSVILNPDTPFIQEIGNVKLSKLDLLALFLKHIKISIEEKNPAQIKKCILVVPTFLSMGLKSVLKLSAKIAGLNDIEILSESLAVAIYYYYGTYEKNQNAKQEDQYVLMNKVERTQVESWLFLMKKDELQIREQVNCTMLYFSKEVFSNGKLKDELSDKEMSIIVKSSNHRCLKQYESMMSTRISTWHTISYKKILYTSDENIKTMYKPNLDLPDTSALFGGMIWANKQFLEESNLRNLNISISTPYIINISTQNERFSRSLKLYNEFYHEPSKWNSLISLRTIGNNGGKDFKFSITEVSSTDGYKTRKICNRLQLECELTPVDEITWNFDQDGTVNFFFLAQEHNKDLIPIQHTWVFDSTPLDDDYLKNSSQQVEKIFSGELNEIFEERKGLKEMMEKSKADMKSKKELNQTLEGRLEDIFKEIDRALGNEKSSKDHLKELKVKLEKYNKILQK